MLRIPKLKNSRQANRIGVLVGGLFLLITLLISRQQHIINKNTERSLLLEKRAAILTQLQSILQNAQSVTRTLAHIIAEYGVPADFDAVASDLIDGSPYLSAIQFLDEGTITHVYPLKGNEVVLGYNVLGDTSRNQELLEAVAKRTFVFAGPFELRQGGKAVVGRQPIFRGEQFIGLTAVIIRWDVLLQQTQLEQSDEAFYRFQLYKLNPYTGAKVALLEGDQELTTDYSEVLQIPEGSWELQLLPVKPVRVWDQWPIFLFGLLLSAAAALLIRKLLREPLKLNELVEERTRAMLASQSLYRDTILRISDGFASVARDGTILYCNEQAAMHFDVSADALIGQSAWTILAGLEGTGLRDGIERALETGRDQHFEAQKPTDFSWYSINIYPSAEGFSVFATDITYEKEATRLLELTNKVARIGGWEYFSSRRLFNISPVCAELLQVPEGSRLRVEDFPQYFGEDAQKILQALREVEGKQHSFDIEVRVIHGYAEPLWVRIIAEVHFDLRGERRVYGTIQDIQAKVRTQQMLASNARQYRSLFDLNPLPMWTFSRESLEIVDANSAACLHYGYGREEMIGKPIALLWEAEAFEKYLEPLFAAAREAFRAEHQRKDGSRMKVEVMSRPIEMTDGMAELMLVRDITEKIAHLEAIETQNLRLREIAWLQSHQVRAPLARIMAIIQLLELEQQGGGATELLREVLQSAYELDGIIAEIAKRTAQTEQVGGPEGVA